MIERILHMLKKEWIQLFRDPKMWPVLFIMPVVQILIFGYAATTDVRNVRTAVYDLDNSLASRELVARMERSGYFQVVAYVADEAQAQDVLDRSDATVLLRTNKGFSEQLAAGRSAPVQVLIDGTDSNTARVVLGYIARIAGDYSSELLVQRIQRQAGPQVQPTFTLASRAWFNENLESRDYYVPGVIAILVMVSTLMLTSMAVVREREVGTMEQIIVTPIRPIEFILGKSLPFVFVGLFEVLLISLVGLVWFDVPLRGSKLLLAGSSLLYLMVSIGAGLLISTVSRTQQQALMLTFFFNFPAILLSGFMFPIANMPQAVQVLTYLNPLRYFLVILRGIFLKGVGPSVLWPQVLALAGMGVCVFWLAARRLSKRMV